jgi:hypothetical protein
VILLGFNEQLVCLTFERMNGTELHIRNYWLEGKFLRLRYSNGDAISVASSILIAKDCEPLENTVHETVDYIFKSFASKSRGFGDYLSSEAGPFERAIAYALINVLFNNGSEFGDGLGYEHLCITEWMRETKADYYTCIGGKAERMASDGSNRLTHKKNSLRSIMDSLKTENNAHSKKDVCAITDVCMLYSGAMDAFLKLTQGQRRVFIGGRSSQVPLDFMFGQHIDAYATKPIQNNSLEEFERRVYVPQKGM